MTRSVAVVIGHRHGVGGSGAPRARSASLAAHGHDSKVRAPAGRANCIPRTLLAAIEIAPPNLGLGELERVAGALLVESPDQLKEKVLKLGQALSALRSEVVDVSLERVEPLVQL